MLTVDLDLKCVPSEALMQELLHRMRSTFEIRQEKWNGFTFLGESYALKIINLNEVNPKEYL